MVARESNGEETGRMILRKWPTEWWVCWVTQNQTMECSGWPFKILLSSSSRSTSAESLVKTGSTFHSKESGTSKMHSEGQLSKTLNSIHSSVLRSTAKAQCLSVWRSSDRIWSKASTLSDWGYSETRGRGCIVATLAPISSVVPLARQLTA